MEYVHIKADGVLAIGREGDARAVVAPAAEGVDGFGVVGEVLEIPAVADGVFGVAADTKEPVKLRVFITTAVHAKNQFVANRAEPNAAHRVGAEGELLRLAAQDRHSPRPPDALRLVS